MSYKMEFAGLEGWFMGALLMALPFVILTVFVKLFLSEALPTSESATLPVDEVGIIEDFRAGNMRR